MELALADLDEAGLRETAGQLASGKTEISTHVVDVADRARMEAFASQVLHRHGRVTLLINNAGVALYGNFEELTIAEIEWLMGINFWGVVHGVKYFLPALKQQPRAHIVNLSSIWGIVAPAGHTAYCASKFAVRGFTEALCHELEGTSVRVSTAFTRAGSGPQSRGGRDWGRERIRRCGRTASHGSSTWRERHRKRRRTES